MSIAEKEDEVYIWTIDSMIADLEKQRETMGGDTLISVIVADENDGYSIEAMTMTPSEFQGVPVLQFEIIMENGQLNFPSEEETVEVLQ